MKLRIATDGPVVWGGARIETVSDSAGMTIETGIAQVWVQIGPHTEVSLEHLIKAHRALKSTEDFFTAQALA
jgi:hypothetical protein